MSTGERPVVTALTAATWRYWGLCWLASLRDVAGWAGPVTVVDEGLTPAQAEALAGFNVNVIGPAGRFADPWLGVLDTVGGDLVYADRLCYFQAPVPAGGLRAAGRVDSRPALAGTLPGMGFAAALVRAPGPVALALERVIELYGTLLGTAYLAGDVTRFLAFCRHNIDLGVINDEPGAGEILLNLYAVAGRETVLATECSPVGRHLGAGLTCDGAVVPVVCFSAEAGATTEAAPYQFMNVHPAVYRRWLGRGVRPPLVRARNNIVPGGR